MINEVRNMVLAILNKENNGYITPFEFNLFASSAQNDEFNNIHSEYALAVQKVNARLYGSGNADILKKLEETIDIFTIPNASLTYSSGSFTIPSDNFRLNHLKYGGRKVENVTQNKIDLLLLSNDTAPTVTFPVYTLSGNKATVYPSTIQSGVTASYIRNPKIPKWTYTTVGSAPLFNPGASDYQDFELPESYKYRLAVRILQMAGISIRESEVVQAAKSEELQNKQEQ